MKSIGEWNWAIAVSLARYNAVMVESVFSKWTKEEFEHPPLHEIIFCATNLTFSTELYLKSVCAACSETLPPKSHKLSTIFNNIPRDDRTVILGIYNENFESEYANLSRGEIWLKLNDAGLPSDKRPTNLMEVLDHYSCSYEDWRYIFAIQKKQNPSNLRCLHYSRLMCLCKSTDKYLQIKFPEIMRRDTIRILQD